ncbi:MAG: hypothetical protein ACD_62C00189G0011, partial [uncultured bacterium]
MIKQITTKHPLFLIILDGWGHRKEKTDNGIELAQKPFFDSLLRDYPHTLIECSGKAVGLPSGVMGNSEVGHMNIGAGRVVYTGLSQIYKAIEDKTFFENPALLQAIHQAKNHNSTLHLMGLLSDGAVHSHQDHLFALLALAKQHGLSRVAIHCFLDGRDTPPQDGCKYLQQLQNKISQIGIGSIASLGGRYWAMDRDKRWDRNEKAFWAICGQTNVTTTSPEQYLMDSYKKGVGDEFVEPAAVLQERGDTIKVTKDDAFIFYNFRADRAKQITRALCQKEFSEFDRKTQSLPAVFVCASPYDTSIVAPIAFTPNYPINTLGEIVAKQGLRQLRIAETEKYAHVTFFFNGGRDVIFDNEDRKLIPSPRDVSTYDLKPQMSAEEITDQMLQLMSAQHYDLTVLNFANADMVGHTAVPQAVIQAIETVDRCLSRLLPAILHQGGIALVFADHGNAEELLDHNGSPMTAHTLNPVPFVLVSNQHQGVALRSGGRLCD